MTKLVAHYKHRKALRNDLVDLASMTSDEQHDIIKSGL
jgi:hypothetical protein